MIESTYHIAKNASTVHTHFKLNCGYCPSISYKKIPIIGIFYVSLLEQDYKEGAGV